MEKELNKVAELLNNLYEVRLDIEEIEEALCELEEKVREQDSNRIKDINNLKQELKRDGLYSDKMEEFLENYMKYYNK